MTLITQNIDNFQASFLKSKRINKQEGTPDFAFTDGVFEIHGNWKYMRCSNIPECPTFKDFYKTPLPLPEP
jgi:NAD-dependent SIR2 family protein deacetylase